MPACLASWRSEICEPARCSRMNSPSVRTASCGDLSEDMTLAPSPTRSLPTLVTLPRSASCQQALGLALEGGAAHTYLQSGQNGTSDVIRHPERSRVRPGPGERRRTP